MALRQALHRLLGERPSTTSAEISSASRALSELIACCNNLPRAPPHRRSQNALPSRSDAALLADLKADQTLDTFEISDVSVLFQWITSILKAPSTSDGPIFDFLEELDSLLSVCREQRRLPQLDALLPAERTKIESILNDLLAALVTAFRHFSQRSRGGSATVDNEVRVYEALNSMSNAIGSLLWGNLQLIRKETLVELTWALLTEITSRMDHSSSKDPYPIYMTLSHLAYLRSVWDNRESVTHTPDKRDFLSEPKLFHALLEAFVTGLKRSDPRGCKNALDLEHNMGLRQTTMACLNGLSQLLLRRSPKLTPSTSTLIIRVVWSHIIILSRQCLTATPCSTSQTTFDSQSESCSEFSSPGLSSSEESYESMESLVHPGANTIDYCSLPPGTVYNISAHMPRLTSSGDDLPAPATTASATESIASGLLTAVSPSGTLGDAPVKSATVRIPRTKRSRRHGANSDPVIKSSGKRGFSNQLKAYALGVFCIRRLLDGCRAQITLDVWPTIMCGDQLPSQPTPDERLSDALRDCHLAPSGVPGTDGSYLQAAPDLLHLIYRTGDKGIRQMLVDILIYLLSSVGRRFAMAEDLTPHSGSFVPYSVRLAVELRHLHRRILLALSSETWLGLQALLLKALTTLVHITPYQRLQPGLLTSLLPALHQLLHRTSTDTRVIDLRAGCLNLLANIVGKVPGPLLEVCQILSPSTHSNSETLHATSGSQASCPPGTLSSSGHPSTAQFRPPNCWSPTHSQNSFTPCWLVQVCLRLIHPDVSTFAWDSRYSDTVLDTEQPLQVRVQALAVLRELVPSYAGFLRPSLPVIEKALLFCLQDLPANKPLWSATLKFLDVFLLHLATATTESPDGSVYVYSDDVLKSWWGHFIPPVIHILQNSNDVSDRLWCCRLFSAWNYRVASLLLSAEISEESLFWRTIQSLRTACESVFEQSCGRAIRTLASLACFTPLKYKLDLCYYVIVSAKQLWERAQFFAVGLDLAWAISGALELLVVLKDAIPIIEESNHWLKIEEQLREYDIGWPNLVRICCDLASPDASRFSKSTNNSTNTAHSVVDPEQVKNPDAHRCEHGAKALGCLMRLLSPGLLDNQKTLNLLIESMCAAMITEKVCSSEKIRWNANLAAGNLFRNHQLWSQLATAGAGSTDFIFSKEALHLYGTVLDHLVLTFTKDKYFKTRTYAANSLLYLFRQEHRSQRKQQLNSELFNILQLLNTVRITSKYSVEETTEWQIVGASFEVLENVEEREFGNSLSTQLESTFQDMYSSANHLTEGQYRLQCLHSAVLLLFYSLTSLISCAPTEEKHVLSDWASELNTLLGCRFTATIQKKIKNLLDEFYSCSEQRLPLSSHNVDSNPSLTEVINAADPFEKSEPDTPQWRLNCALQQFQFKLTTLLHILDSLEQSPSTQHLKCMYIFASPTRDLPESQLSDQLTKTNADLKHSGLMYTFRQIYD